MTTEPLEQRRPAAVWTVLSFFWALIPALSIGFLTPIAFGIAWVRCRTIWSFLSFAGYFGLFAWVVAADGGSLSNFTLGLHVFISWMLATAHTFVIRKKVLRGATANSHRATPPHLPPSEARKFWSIVWALSPMITFGFGTPVTFIIACARRRTVPDFLSAALYLAIFAWRFTVTGTPQEALATNVALPMLWIFATVHAFAIRQRIWYHPIPHAVVSAPSQTHYEGPVASASHYQFEALSQPPGSYFTAPYPYTTEFDPKPVHPEQTGMPHGHTAERATEEAIPEPNPSVQTKTDPVPSRSILEIPPLPRILQPEPERAGPTESGPPAEAKLDASTLGAEICGSDAYLRQVNGVRRAPEPETVAAVIHAADNAGGLLTSAEIARISGRPTSSIGGYISQLQRVLNIDGTQVLAKVDDGNGIRIDLDLLRQQFLGGNR